MRLIDADNLVKCVELIQAKASPAEIVKLVNAQLTMPAEIVHEAEIVTAGYGGGTQWHECSRCETPVDLGDKRCKGCGAYFREVPEFE